MGSGPRSGATAAALTPPRAPTLDVRTGTDAPLDLARPVVLSATETLCSVGSAQL